MSRYLSVGGTNFHHHSPVRITDICKKLGLFAGLTEQEIQDKTYYSCQNFTVNSDVADILDIPTEGFAFIGSDSVVLVDIDFDKATTVKSDKPIGKLSEVLELMTNIHLCLEVGFDAGFKAGRMSKIREIKAVLNEEA